MAELQKIHYYRFLLIIFLVLAVYGNSLRNGFVWDDGDVIVNNPQIRSLKNIPTFFISEDRIEKSTGYYRPMTYVSFALDNAIWGKNSVGYNITSLSLHCATAILLFMLVASLFGSEQLALFTALIFALHPLAGETVNFHAGGRNTLLCAFFGLLSLLLHTQKKPLLATLCLTVAIFSKEFGLLLPIFMYASDRLVNRRNRPASYAPYLIPIACFFILRSIAVAHANIFDSMAFSDNLLHTPSLITNYLIHMLYPFNQKVLYGVHPSVIDAALSSLAIAALIILAWYFKRIPEIGSSVGWFLIFLLPVANIVLLPSASLMADRYGYISLMGFALFIAYVIDKLPIKISYLLIAIVCCSYSIVDINRNTYWKSDFTFNNQMIKDAPEMALGYHNQGVYFYKKGDIDNAEKCFLLADAKNDVSPRLLSISSSLLWESNRLESVKKILLHQIRLEPANPQSYMMLKMIYAKQGKADQAKSYGDKASELFPGIQETMKKRTVEICSQAEAFITMRSFDKAENLLREALIIDPDFVPALIDMGSIKAEKGNSDKATEYFTKAIALDPQNASVHYNLSQVYQMQGKTVAANEEMKKYDDLTSKQNKAGDPPTRAQGAARH